MTDDLDAAFDSFLTSLDEATRFVRAHPFFADTENRASAYAFLASMLVARIEENVSFSIDQPYFRVLDHRIREGGDNPDQRYLLANIRGGETYRIWGNRGTARRVDLQLYAGVPYGGRGGRSASFLDVEDITFDANGDFSIIASPERCDGDWIENPPDATRVLVRQVYSDWAEEVGGEVHIDHVGHEGDLQPVLTEAEMATRFSAAADSLALHVEVWPEMVRNLYLERRPANELPPPFDPGTVGGVPGRFMCNGAFQLEDDEALVVTTWPMAGDYQGIQLADLWFSSLEYGNRQTSLTGDQAHLDDDGAYRFVVCGTDPGVANWLDTMGRRRGLLLLRFDGMKGRAFEPAKHPTTAVVPLADLDAHLPPSTRRVTPAERAAAIATRRRHVQRRYGY
jgi:hypothetical protein